jgi:hypothetical protein
MIKFGIIFLFYITFIKSQNLYGLGFLICLNFRANIYGQLGLGDVSYRFHDSLDNNLTFFNNKTIKQGSVNLHCMFLTSDNILYSFGSNIVNYHFKK